MPQCQAKSKRTHEQCKNWAIRGMKVCRFHGGILGGKKAQKKRLMAVLKHGNRTKAEIEKRKQITKFLKAQKNALNELS